MKKLLESIIQVEAASALNFTLDTPPDSPLDSPKSEETHHDYVDIPLFAFEIPLPPGKPPASSIYSNEGTEDFENETNSLYPTSVIIISPDMPRICNNYQQGMCRNENCQYAHEVDTAELQSILSRFVKASAYRHPLPETQTW